MCCHEQIGAACACPVVPPPCREGPLSAAAEVSSKGDLFLKARAELKLAREKSQYTLCTRLGLRHACFGSSFVFAAFAQPVELVNDDLAADLARLLHACSCASVHIRSDLTGSSL